MIGTNGKLSIIIYSCITRQVHTFSYSIFIILAKLQPMLVCPVNNFVFFIAYTSLNLPNSEVTNPPENLTVEPAILHTPIPRHAKILSKFFKILHDKLLCTCLFFIAEYGLIIGVLLVAIVTLICGVIFTARVHHSSKTINSGNIIDYANDTISLGSVNQENQRITIEHPCSSDNYIVDLFLGPNCNKLNTYPKQLSFQSQSTYSKKNMITEILFAWGSVHIYLLQGSFLTFTVDLIAPVPTDPLMLVVFNNYTYYTDYIHSISPNPNTDKSYLLHKFEVDSGLSFTFTSVEETTYFFAISSSAGTNYSYGYNGTVYSYNYTNYNEPVCQLPPCENKQCAFDYSGDDKCILAHIKPTFSGRTFGYIHTNISQRSTMYKQRTLGIVFLSIACSIIIITILTMAIVWFKRWYQPLQRVCCNARGRMENEPLINRPRENYGGI